MEGWGSFRVLMTSSKPTLAPLASLPFAEETVPEKQQALTNSKIPVLARAPSTPATGSLVISSTPRGRDAELSLQSALTTLRLPNRYNARHVLPWPRRERQRNEIQINQLWNERRIVVLQVLFLTFILPEADNQLWVHLVRM